MGVGMDLGAVWNVNDHWKISGSLTDLGAIYWNSDTRNYSLHQKSYIFQGIQVDALNNFNNFSDSLNAIFKPDTSYNNFKTTLKSKLYLQSSFDFGKGNQVSLISRNIFYRNGIVNTTMVSYHKRVGRALDCSVGYSVFDLRYSQLGAGFAVNLGGVNLYLVSDNMLAFFHPENNHSADFVFGINVNFLGPR